MLILPKMSKDQLFYLQKWHSNTRPKRNVTSTGEVSLRDRDQADIAERKKRNDHFAKKGDLKI